MLRAVLPLLLGLLLLLQGSTSFQAFGILRRIDVERRVLHVFSNGQERMVPLARGARILNKEGKSLPGALLAPELAAGAEITVTVERGDAGPQIAVIRLGRQPLPGETMPRTSVGLKPLSEMSASDRSKGEDGGLYGGGSNVPPPALREAARKEAARIAPLDAEGRPSPAGAIGLVSISMSNATQEFSMFKQIADRDPRKSERLTIVDCAQGGQAMAQWVDPQGRAWLEADRRLQAAGVSPKQVQVAWVKLANMGPRGELTEHGKKLESDTRAVLQNARRRFPNLRIAYLGSRIYGGYAGTPLNPEPYAYESAFVVRWLIQSQSRGDAELNANPERGDVRSALLLWGPYFWGDGVTPRKSDGLIWERADLTEDGTHPSQTGRRKVADMLLKFFVTDETAAPWFARPVGKGGAGG